MKVRDSGERLFELYAEQRGYTILAYEPDLGTAKRPDYLVSASGVEVVVEVESMADKALGLPSQPGGSAALSKLSAVRNKITAGAEQLKGIADRPLVVIIANPAHVPVRLAASDIIAAMYGDLALEYPPDEQPRWRLGRNGRLQVLEADGSTRGNHPYLGAVGVLRQGTSIDQHVVTSLGASDGTNPVRALAQALTGEDDRTMQDPTVSLDVFESVSDVAVPLPRTTFNGLGDTRWGQVANGHYGPIRTDGATPLHAN